jgi:hypothetical protein
VELKSFQCNAHISPGLEMWELKMIGRYAGGKTPLAIVLASYEAEMVMRRGRDTVE